MPLLFGASQIAIATRCTSTSVRLPSSVSRFWRSSWTHGSRTIRCQRTLQMVLSCSPAICKHSMLVGSACSPTFCCAQLKVGLLLLEFAVVVFWGRILGYSMWISCFLSPHSWLHEYLHAWRYHCLAWIASLRSHFVARLFHQPLKSHQSSRTSGTSRTSSSFVVFGVFWVLVAELVALVRLAAFLTLAKTEFAFSQPFVTKQWP